MDDPFVKTVGSNRYILAGSKGTWRKKRGDSVDVTVVNDVLIGDTTITVETPDGKIHELNGKESHVFTKGWPGEVYRDPDTGRLTRTTTVSSYEVQFIVRAVMKNLGIEWKEGDERYHSSVRAAWNAIMPLRRGGPPDEKDM